MLSESLFSEIARLTQEALAELSSRSVVECVTVIRGYVQLLRIYPERKEYRDRLVGSLLNLAGLLSSQAKTKLAFEIDALIVNVRKTP